MPLTDDIVAIRAREDLTEQEKRAQIYNLKSTALIDVIYNGKPAPNPIPPLIRRTFTVDGKSIRIDYAVMLSDSSLRVDVLVNGVLHQLVIVNPPILPRVLTGNEKQDLIQTVGEILAGIS